MNDTARENNALSDHTASTLKMSDPPGVWEMKRLDEVPRLKCRMEKIGSVFEWAALGNGAIGLRDNGDAGNHFSHDQPFSRACR
jgi:hypothetical protein